MADLEIVDVTDQARFGRIPPCADGGFDHRSCDYWEDADRGSKAARLSWLPGSSAAAAMGGGASVATSFGRSGPGSLFASENPFAPPPRSDPNPFAPASSLASGPARNPFLEERDDPLADNPFAPRKPARPTVAADAPRKLQLLGRGLGIFGSYAKVLVLDGEPAVYCQFGPLSAYPRALRLRELYPQLPQAPMPAVITCIASTSAARRQGLAARLVSVVCEDLAARGFSAVEAYPEAHTREDATPAARPDFWLGTGFKLAIDDERYPVMRREL